MPGENAAAAHQAEAAPAVAGSAESTSGSGPVPPELERTADFADFIENAPAGIRWVGPDGTILRANRAELEMLGYERKEYVGHPITEFFADREVIDDMLQRLLQGETLRNRPARMRSRNGKVLDVRINSSGLFEHGRFLHTRCVTIDVTDHELRLRLTHQAGKMGSWDWDVASDRIEWDATLEAIHGLHPGTFSGTFQAFQQDIHPEDRRRVMNAVSVALQGDKEHHIEYRIVRPDGTLRWVEAHGTVLRDGSGAAVRMIGVCADVTERKQADLTIRSLLRISERLNSTLDIDTLLDILVQEAITLIGAESGVAGLYAPQGMESRRYFQRGTAIPLEYRWPPMHGLPGWLIENKVPYLTNDAMQDGQIVHELCVRFGVKSALSVPILGAGGQVLGFFEIHNKSGGFTGADTEALLAVSHSASIAIQNTIAYRRLRETENTIRESERTQRLLAELGAISARAGNGVPLEDCIRESLERVAASQNVSRCGLAQVDLEADRMVVFEDFHSDFASMKGAYSLSDYAETLVPDALQRKPAIVNDAASDPRTARRYESAYVPLSIRAYVNVPLYRNGAWVANFFVTSQEPRAWTGPEIELLQAAGDRVWLIVEQARTAAELRDSEERFARFMEHLPGLAWIKDLAGRYVFANDAAERAFRTSRAQLYGRTDEQVFDPSTADLFRRNDRRAEASGSGIQTVETLEHADGVHHSLVHKFPIRNKDGKIGWVGGVAIDISERIRAEEGLRASEQRYRAVVESQTEMLCRFRADGTILFVNEPYARSCGSIPEALVGRTFWDFIAPEERPAVAAALDALTVDSPELRLENRFKSVDGERWTLWTNRALSFDASGRFQEAQATGIDITDRKRAEEALQRANEALRRANADLEQFAYSASHDLQEPIRNISISTEIVAERYRDKLDQPALEYLALATAAANRLNILVRDLLAYTQSAGDGDPAPEEVDANAAFDKALSNISATVEQSNAAISAGRLPEVRIQESQLQQLFQNLISNAIKYRSTDDVPRIHVTAVRNGSEWVFSVRDNGIGIAPQFQRRIFGIFKRLHGQDKYAGTGIGLAICQRIVERGGGRIWVESEGEGHGSTFFFTIPA